MVDDFDRNRPVFEGLTGALQVGDLQELLRKSPDFNRAVRDLIAANALQPTSPLFSGGKEACYRTGWRFEPINKVQKPTPTEGLYLNLDEPIKCPEEKTEFAFMCLNKCPKQEDT